MNTSQSPEPANAPYRIIGPVRPEHPLILASPHSGRIYPPALLAASRLSIHQLRRSEDMFVDELISGAPALGLTCLLANVSRVYIDLNRDANELDVGMFHGDSRRVKAQAQRTERVRAGLGVVPRIAGLGQDIYRQRLPVAEVEDRLCSVYHPYHAALRGLLDAAVERFGFAVLIDCHSMPTAALEAGTMSGQLPHVVIGDNHGTACHPDLSALVEAACQAQQLRSVRNVPYSGGFTTTHYGQPDRRVHCLQLELDRGCYMDQMRFQRLAAFAKMRESMGRVFARVKRDIWLLGPTSVLDIAAE